MTRFVERRVILILIIKMVLLERLLMIEPDTRVLLTDVCSPFILVLDFERGARSGRTSWRGTCRNSLRVGAPFLVSGLIGHRIRWHDVRCIKQLFA